jgi:hypothetical protein
VSIIALVTWITAASGGLYLLSIWLIEYDKDFQAASATRLPPTVLALHVLFAAGGLLVWAAYLFYDQDRLAWASLAALCIAATLGTVMGIRWISVYRTGRAIKERLRLAQSEQFATAGAPASPLAADDLDAAYHRIAFEPAYRGRGNGRAGGGSASADRGRPDVDREPDRLNLSQELGRTEVGPPERNFPLPVVIAHGVFAAVTLGLVLLVALGVGGS